MTSVVDIQFVQDPKHLSIEAGYKQDFPQIAVEWAQRHSAQRKTIRRWQSGAASEIMSEQAYYDQHGAEFDDYMDLQDKINNAPTFAVDTYVIDNPDATVSEDWKETKTTFPAYYEHIRISHLVLFANNRQVAKYEQIRDELKELGYSDAALASVPLKPQDQLDHEKIELDRIAKQYGQD